MNKRLILSLLSSQIIFTSLMSVLGIVTPAHAAQRAYLTKDGRACITHPHGGMGIVCTRVTERQKKLIASRANTNTQVVSAKPSEGEGMMLKFSEKESDEAIRLFTCDCPYCMNALRTLEGGEAMVY